MEPPNDTPLNNEYVEIFQRVSLWKQLAYGVGHVLNDVCASIWFTYLLVYMHLVLKFANWEAGLFLLIGQVVDAISTPFVGYGSDLSGSYSLCKYGKRKTWHLIGTILIVFSFPQLFTPCHACSDGSMFLRICYYGGLITIFQFGWASVQISHLSLIPEITPNENDRVKLTAIRYGFTVISNLFVYGITWSLLSSRDTRIGPEDAGSFQQIAWMGVSFGMLCSCIFHLLIYEHDDEQGNNVRAAQPRINTRDLFRDRRLYQVAIIYMCTRLFVNLMQVFTPLYLVERLSLSASTLALIPLIMYLGSLVASVLVGKINKWCGRKEAYLVGTVIGLIGCIWIKYSPVDQIIHRDIYIIAVFLGVAGSIVLVTSLGITADFIGERTGSSAFIYGVMSFTDKLSNGIAVVVIENLHQTYTSDIYYENILFYVCGGVMMFAGTILLFFKMGFITSNNRNTERRRSGDRGNRYFPATDYYYDGGGQLYEE